MKVEIEPGLEEKFKFDFEANIKSIIQKIPSQHILGLDKIQVVYCSPERKRRRARGFYYGKNEGEKFPKIVICVNNILQNLPKPVLKLSFIPRLFLAETIFHEVAHHYQRLRHGISKHRWEKDANAYAKRMMKHCLFSKYQLLFLKILFGPFLLFERITNRK